MTPTETQPALEQTLLSLFSKTNRVHVAYSDEETARNQCKELHAFLAAHGKTAGFVAGGTPVEGEEATFRCDAATGTLIPAERAEVYQCDFVFGSAITLAFDFLRDSLSDAPIQTDHDALLLADADRLLSDAPSSLIISAAESGDFTPDETATAIAAAKEKGVDYLVETAPDGSAAIVLLDKLGHLLPGRRLSNGIHEALEIREGLPAKSPPQVIAQTTLPEFAAQYRKRTLLMSSAATPEEITAARERF